MTRSSAQKFDVRPLLHFRSDSVWLDEQRMILLHSTALEGLRNELIRTLGLERTRGLLVRMGFASGRSDANLLSRLVKGAKPQELFNLGPVLHGLEGLVSARITALDMDIDAGHFYMEGIWDSSWEDDSHRSEHAVGDSPACWSQVGYVSGFASAFMGKLIVCKEIKCLSKGDPHCLILARPAEEWPDSDNYLRYFRPDDIAGELTNLREEVAELRASLGRDPVPDGLIGESSAFRAALSLMEKAAETRITVLLLGETGVGKEMFARWLHEHGSRADKPFVAVNCAAIPNDLLESELFGAEKGAYTGAQQGRAGRFERADGGTLFLDEIGDLAPAAQAKLLRVLQTGEIERLGDDRTRKVDVRLVTATNIDLNQAVAEKRFRADLFYRINTYPIEIPPLRSRGGDVLLLAEFFLHKYAEQYAKKLGGITDRAKHALRQYQWPGNIRELENIVERAVLLAPRGGHIEVEHLSANLATDDAGLDASGHVNVSSDSAMQGICEQLLDRSLDINAFEDLLLRTAVRRAEGNLSAAARTLGLTRAQLAYRLR